MSRRLDSSLFRVVTPVVDIGAITAGEMRTVDVPISTNAEVELCAISKSCTCASLGWIDPTGHFAALDGDRLTVRGGGALRIQFVVSSEGKETIVVYGRAITSIAYTNWSVRVSATVVSEYSPSSAVLDLGALNDGGLGLGQVSLRRHDGCECHVELEEASRSALYRVGGLAFLQVGADAERGNVCLSVSAMPPRGQGVVALRMRFVVRVWNGLEWRNAASPSVLVQWSS